MIDVDHFKLYNDTYGHPEGDACLARIRETLAGIAGETLGFAGRYGGEEFCLLLPNTSPQRALEIGETVRATVQGLGLPHITSSHCTVTVSVGVAATLPSDAQTPGDLIEAADAALYAAKHRVRNYTLGDVLARYMRAKGHNVMHPMGWDAFGLPAENAAIERKVAPKAWTYDNIAAMKKQLQSIGLSLDWSREFATCDPSYYKHQQKLFNDFLRAGLAEREKRKVNWDPVDMTVLANEQVIDGRGWRSGAVVEQREMKQWVFKITKYSQELLDALDTLDRWPDKVRLMQRNWIGRSEGMLIRFALDPTTTPSGETELKIFTTRPDTLFGAKFMAISADHPLAQAAAAKNPKLAEFIAEVKKIGTAQEIIDTAEKQGFDTGIEAVHPFDPNWKLPVYVANFVLMEYGTGAIFGCPAHDQRDLDFVNKYK